jgi:hypothetical protein
MNFIRRRLISLTQFINVWLFNGWPDESLSSRAYRQHKAGKRSWPMRIIDFFFWLFFAEVGHCENSYVSEQNKSHLPFELRG